MCKFLNSSRLFSFSLPQTGYHIPLGASVLKHSLWKTFGNQKLDALAVIKKKKKKNTKLMVFETSHFRSGLGNHQKKSDYSRKQSKFQHRSRPWLFSNRCVEVCFHRSSQWGDTIQGGHRVSFQLEY